MSELILNFKTSHFLYLGGTLPLSVLIFSVVFVLFFVMLVVSTHLCVASGHFSCLMSLFLTHVAYSNAQVVSKKQNFTIAMGAFFPQPISLQSRNLMYIFFSS